MKVQGRCHCREVQYEAEVEPGTITVCHCLDCQTMTGSAFRANIRSLPGTFSIVSGQPKRYVKTADSGARRAHVLRHVRRTGLRLRCRKPRDLLPARWRAGAAPRAGGARALDLGQAPRLLARRDGAPAAAGSQDSDAAAAKRSALNRSFPIAG
jgi:Glutathione-dependent formaldehyde-activating enzyme